MLWTLKTYFPCELNNAVLRHPLHHALPPPILQKLLWIILLFFTLLFSPFIADFIVVEIRGEKKYSRLREITANTLRALKSQLMRQLLFAALFPIIKQWNPPNACFHISAAVARSGCTLKVSIRFIGIWIFVVLVSYTLCHCTICRSTWMCLFCIVLIIQAGAYIASHHPNNTHKCKTK